MQVHPGTNSAELLSSLLVDTVMNFFVMESGDRGMQYWNKNALCTLLCTIENITARQLILHMHLSMKAGVGQKSSVANKFYHHLL